MPQETRPNKCRVLLGRQDVRFQFSRAAWNRALTAWVTGWTTLRCGRARLSQRAARGVRTRVRLAEDSEPYLRLLRDQPDNCSPSHSPNSKTGVAAAHILEMKR